MMKKRRYLISVAVLVSCVCMALGVVAMLSAMPGVNKANCDRIKEGMTIYEAHAILGVHTRAQDFEDGKTVFVWRGPDDAYLMILFINGQACVPNWIDGPGADESSLDKIRRWLHIPK